MQQSQENSSDSQKSLVCSNLAKSRQEGSCLGKRQGVLPSHVASGTLTQAERQLLHFLQTQQQSGAFLNQLVNVIQSRGISQSTPTYPSRRVPVNIYESSQQNDDVDMQQDSPGHRRQYEQQLQNQLQQVGVQQSELVGDVSGELREQIATSVSDMQASMTPQGLHTIEHYGTTMSEPVEQQFSLIDDGLPQQLPSVVQQQFQQVQQQVSGVSGVSGVVSRQTVRSSVQWYPDWRYLLQPLGNIQPVHRQMAQEFQQYMIGQYGSIEAAVVSQEMRELNVQNDEMQVEQQQHDGVADVVEQQHVGNQQEQGEISQVQMDQDVVEVQQVDMSGQQQFGDVQQYEIGVSQTLQQQSGEYIEQVGVQQRVSQYEQEHIAQQIEQVLDEAADSNPNPSFEEYQEVEQRIRALLPAGMQPQEPIVSQEQFESAQRQQQIHQQLQNMQQLVTQEDQYERDLANREREIALQQQELQLQRDQLRLEREKFELEQLQSQSKHPDDSISSCDACKSDVLRAQGVDIGLGQSSQHVFVDHGIPLGESGGGSRPTLVPATLKLDKPQSFSGKHSEIQNFIFQIKQYIDSVNLGNGSDACRFITSFFKGDALNWWRSYSLTHDPVFEDLTVDVLLHELQAQFSDLDHEMKVRSKLFNIRQHHSVQNYVNLFRSLQVELGDKRLKGEDEIHVFVQGLKSYPKQQVLIQSPNTLELAIHTAERAEQAQETAYNQRGIYRGNNGNNSNNRGGNNGYRGGRFGAKSNFRGSFGRYQSGFNNSRGRYNPGSSNNSRGGFGRGNFVPYNKISQFGDSGYRGDAPMVMGTAQLNQRGGSNSGSNGVQCYYCGRSGHVKKQCYKWQSDQQSGKQPQKSIHFAGVQVPQQQQSLGGAGTSGANSNSGMQVNTVQVQPGTTYRLADGTIVQGVKAPKVQTPKN